MTSLFDIVRDLDESDIASVGNMLKEENAMIKPLQEQTEIGALKLTLSQDSPASHKL